MSTTPVQIIRRSDKSLLDAILHTELAPSVLIDTEKEWGPLRWAAARELYTQGRVSEIPQHYHWDWARKSQNLGLLAYQCLGIEYDKKLQGLLLVKIAGVEARLDPDGGKPLVYIDYLESAPWNLRSITDTPLYGGVGPVLMQAAVQLSFEEGFHGRIGLHALLQSEEFYRDDCGMHGCGPDASYHNLTYYEMTREIAARFISNASGSTV
jgi:hypothetical protein